jgi:hypothetical protein
MGAELDWIRCTILLTSFLSLNLAVWEFLRFAIENPKFKDKYVIKGEGDD